MAMYAMVRGVGALSLLMMHLGSFPQVEVPVFQLDGPVKTCR